MFELNKEQVDAAINTFMKQMKEGQVSAIINKEGTQGIIAIKGKQQLENIFSILGSHGSSILGAKKI